MIFRVRRLVNAMVTLSRRALLAWLMIGGAPVEAALPFGGSEPAINRVLEIRDKLLAPSTPTTETDRHIVQWPNWPNWPNWSNYWPNWRNWRNW